ncbi:hypothetical protein [Microbacterium resistens]|uniref:hypothetical protein n=1 Tax=Microbacterium resistens TaxID=156977 RepID=UPI00366D63F6
MRVIDLVDTSVFAALIRVPGRDSRHDEVRVEFERRIDAGISFILPVSTIIETGNLIANASGDRRGAAQRLLSALHLARQSSPPWIIRDVPWDSDFLERFMKGDSTGMPLLDHLTAGSIGSGDVAILVERDLIEQSLSNTRARVWTFDNALHAYGRNEN